MNETLFTSLSVPELSEIIKKSISDFFASQHQEQKTDNPADDLLSIEEIQKIFKVSKVTIHKWKKKGLLPFYKMNRKVYFKKSEVITSMCHKKRKLEV